MDAAIGKNVADGTPVRLSHRDRFTGTYIVGKMGMGKSTLIQHLAFEQIENGHGLLVMEPKGDLVSDLLQLIPTHRVNDVILLDYGDVNYPPGFDLFDLAGITTIHERAAYIREIVAGFEKTLGKDSWGANIENLFMAVANTFTQNPGVVLSDIKRILTDDAFRTRCMRNLTSPFTKDARDFWVTYDRMKGKDTYVNGTMTRVQRFLFDPILQAITVQSGRSLDVTKAIRERKIVLIALPERTLGAKGMELLGTLYLSRIRLATQRQFAVSERERIPFFVYLDEFQRFASGDIESFIAEARGAKVGLTMAHQWRSQIEDPGVRAAPMAVGNTFVFQVTPEDAAVFARGFTKYPRETPWAPHVPREWTPPAGLPDPPKPELATWVIGFSHQIFKGMYEGWHAETTDLTLGAQKLDEWILRDLLTLNNREVYDATNHVLQNYCPRLPPNLRDLTKLDKLIEKQFTDVYGKVDRDKLLPYDAIPGIIRPVDTYLLARMRHDEKAETRFNEIVRGVEKAVTDVRRRYFEVLPDAPWPFPDCPHLSPSYESVGTLLLRILERARLLGDIFAQRPLYANFKAIKDAEAFRDKLKSQHEDREFARHMADERAKASTPSREMIASALMHLERYYAHCKLSQNDTSDEMTIAIERIEPSTVSYETEIRERSRRLYCVTMDEAMEMIAVRQEESEPMETELVFSDAPPKRGGV